MPANTVFCSRLAWTEAFLDLCGIVDFHLAVFIIVQLNQECVCSHILLIFIAPVMYMMCIKLLFVATE